jgi:hypothetical protein
MSLLLDAETLITVPDTKHVRARAMSRAPFQVQLGVIDELFLDSVEPVRGVVEAADVFPVGELRAGRQGSRRRSRGRGVTRSSLANEIVAAEGIIRVGNFAAVLGAASSPARGFPDTV